MGLRSTFLRILALDTKPAPVAAPTTQPPVPAEAPVRISALLDLALVLHERGMEPLGLPIKGDDTHALIAAALDRCFPAERHSRETCPVAECQDHGCDECPSSAELDRMDDALTVFLNQTPRPVLTWGTTDRFQSQELARLRAENARLRAEVRLRSIGTAAAWDVLFERARQIEVEAYSAKRDDRYVNEELAYAAGCYLAPIWADSQAKAGNAPPVGWPWAPEHWKPTNRRRAIVKGLALGLAELERLDRAKRAEPVELPCDV